MNLVQNIDENWSISNSTLDTAPQFYNNNFLLSTSSKQVIFHMDNEWNVKLTESFHSNEFLVLSKVYKVKFTTLAFFYRFDS